MTAVRRANTEEIDSAVAAWQAANPHTTIPEHAQWLRARAADPDALLLVAEMEGQVIGMVLVLPGRDRDGAGDILPGQHHLTGLAVHPGYQRCGAGSALLDAALSEAAERASTRVTLWAAKDNATAQRLFTVRGFTPTGRTGRDAGGTVMLNLEHRIARSVRSVPHKKRTPRHYAEALFRLQARNPCLSRQVPLNVSYQSPHDLHMIST